jgi:hypothetical protein
MVEAFHEDFETILNSLMLIDLQATFTMMSLCYAQHLGYLLCIVFPSLGILQHYVNFDTCIITMLEKLLGVRFFGGFIDHQTCHHAILLIFLSRLASLL